MRNGEVCRRLNGPKIAGDAIDTQGDTLLTAASRSSDQLQVWSIKEEKVIATLRWEGNS